jgi:hypothetical protein
MSAFQMELNDYPHFNLTEDGRLCVHGPALPGVPKSAIQHTCPSWLRRGRSGLPLPTVHSPWPGPFDPMKPWLGSIICSEPDTSIELMVHMALTSLCEDHLAATAALPIALLLIRNQENPVWQQCLEVVSNLKGPHFHVRMTSLVRYAQYLFNLQHNTAKTGMQQRTRLTAYKESATATTREIERLRHENAILRSGARALSEQDHELQEVYRRLSNAERG